MDPFPKQSGRSFWWLGRGTRLSGRCWCDEPPAVCDGFHTCHDVVVYGTHDSGRTIANRWCSKYCAWSCHLIKRSCPRPAGHSWLSSGVFDSRSTTVEWVHGQSTTWPNLLNIVIVCNSIYKISEPQHTHIHIATCACIYIYMYIYNYICTIGTLTHTYIYIHSDT